MRNKTITAGRKVASAIRPSEDSIDGSILKGAALLTSLVEGRLEAGVAASVGHDAVMSAAKGLSALAEARNYVVACHMQITTVRDDLGFPEQAFGCTIGKAPGPQGLRAVGEEAA